MAESYKPEDTCRVIWRRCDNLISQLINNAADFVDADSLIERVNDLQDEVALLSSDIKRARR